MLMISGQAIAKTISGPAQVKDGDSLVILGREIRLDDLDAPEWGQECSLPDGRKWYPGREAAAWLASFLAGKTVSCVSAKTDHYGRTVAHCYSDGQDLNTAIVTAGWAFAYRRYSDRQVAAETEAREGKRGLWRGNCEIPEQWRITHKKNNGADQ